MWEFITWLIFAVLAVIASLVVVLLMAKPTRFLLGASSHMAPAQSFYVRAFAVAVFLGTLAVIADHSVPGPKDANMEYVWWVADGLGPVFWSIALFLSGLAILLTLLFAVLGRYRDQ